MNFIKFIFSRVFIKQIFLAIIIFILLCIAILGAISYFTNHNQYIKVPNLESLSIDAMKTILDQSNLRYEVLDSAKYNSNYPPLRVIEQIPKFNDLVKENRKIYITLNPIGYRKLSVPNVIQITKRNAETRLKAVGFFIGNKTYRNNIGKDMVLELKYRGKKIEPGILLPKNSSIDLILGNGKK